MTTLRARSAGAGRHLLTDVERAERRMIEAELQDLVVGTLSKPGLAVVLGWDWLHVRPGLRANGRWWTATTGTLAKWPDLFLVRARDRRIVIAELKRELERPTAEQDQVLDVLRALSYDEQPLTADVAEEIRGARGTRIDVCVWRPSDLRDPIETSRIYEVLR